MAYNSLADFVQVLAEQGELKRITYPVKAELEITEIADRVMKSNGPALFFENVVGKQIPLLINAFGSMRRMALALGVNDVEEIAREIEKLIHTKPPKSFKDKLSAFGRTHPPRWNTTQDCKRRRLPAKSFTANPILDILPGAHLLAGGCRPFHYPADGLLAKDPRTGTRNVGLYRMQVYDRRTTGMHWHLHKVGARHFLHQKKRPGKHGTGGLLRR